MEDRMDYGNLLSRAWQITWKHKILWVFGILAGLGGGGGNFSFNFGGRSGTGGASNGGASPLPPDILSQLSRPETLAIILVVGCVLIVLALVLLVLGIIGRGGLIGGINLAVEHDSVTFREAWSIGTHYFWRMLGISLVLILPTILIAFVVGAIAILTAGIGLLCLLPLICLLLPPFIVLGIIAHFAQFAVVLEDLGVMDSFRRGWAVLTTNLGNIIVVGIILFVIDFIIGIVLFLPVLVIIVPTGIAILLGGNQTNLAALAVGGVALVCYLPVAIVLGGIVHAWSIAVWTLLYRHVTGSTPMLHASGAA
jgi:hypothetical protein